MNKRKLSTLLLNPPQTFYHGSQGFSKSFPLGLAYIAGVLDQEGYPVVYEMQFYGRQVAT